jgi:predicted HTH domain antitoxin
MALKRVEVELPEELWQLAGISAKRANAQFREMLVMELLRRGKLSQGKAAELLGIDRWQLVDVMAAYDVPTTVLTKADLKREQAHWERLRSKRS